MGRVSTKGKGFTDSWWAPGRARFIVARRRSAALVQRSAREGGGILCSFDSDGKTRFLEHTSENAPQKHDELLSITTAGKTRY